MKTVWRYFDRHGRLSIKREFMKGATRELREGWREGGKLSEVNARTEPRRQNELVGKFKMAASDLVSVRGQVMEYTYIPTGTNYLLAMNWKYLNFS